MPRGCRFLKLYGFEPRVFARGLVKMSVNTNIARQINISFRKSEFIIVHYTHLQKLVLMITTFAFD